MQYLEYLYYRYYIFQVKVGNSDVAPFSSMLIIFFTLILYYFGTFFILITVLPNIILDMKAFGFVSAFLFIYLFIYLYFKLLYKDKYKSIIQLNKNKEEKRLGAIFFPLLAFIIFILAFVLKILQNQGKL